MALKMLYRGPSSRLENLIEKIASTKDSGRWPAFFYYKYIFPTDGEFGRGSLIFETVNGSNCRIIDSTYIIF